MKKNKLTKWIISIGAMGVMGVGTIVGLSSCDNSKPVFVPKEWANGMTLNEIYGLAPNSSNPYVSEIIIGKVLFSHIPETSRYDTPITSNFLDSIQDLDLSNLTYNDLYWEEMLATKILYNCNNLQNLDISYNPIISFDISHFPKLETFDCSSTSLNAFEANDMSNLKTIDASYAHLSYEEINNCPHLTSVDLTGNNFHYDPNTGSHDVDIKNCPSILSLNLSHNILTNSMFVYQDLSQLPKLTVLNLNDCGVDDLDLSGLTNLRELYLVEDPLGDSIPDKRLFSLTPCKNSLETLGLEGCHLNALPDGFADCTGLTALNLSFNSLEDNLDLSGFVNLDTLELRNNSFSTINLANLTKLQYINTFFCNELTTLDLSASLALEDVRIGYCDKLGTLTMPAAANMKNIYNFNADWDTNMIITTGGENGTLDISASPGIETISLVKTKISAVKIYANDIQPNVNPMEGKRGLDHFCVTGNPNLKFDISIAGDPSAWTDTGSIHGFLNLYKAFLAYLSVPHDKLQYAPGIEYTRSQAPDDSTKAFILTTSDKRGLDAWPLPWEWNSPLL